MFINRKCIRNPRRYLYALHAGDKFYVAAKLSDEDVHRLQRYGIRQDASARIPTPHRSATRLNADGKWILLRDLPKKIRQFVHAYHLVDWHGQDHYGTCIQERWCYQRELVSPA